MKLDNEQKILKQFSSSLDVREDELQSYSSPMSLNKYISCLLYQ